VSVAALKPEVLGAVNPSTINSDLQFRAIFEAAAIGINICALDGHILQSNPAVTRMLGYTREELAGMHPGKLHPDDPEQDELSELIHGIRDSFEVDKQFPPQGRHFLLGSRLRFRGSRC
jgi:PAS domain S-box-containing protein